MNIRQLAQTHLAKILDSDSIGNSQSVFLTSPANVTETIEASTSDVSSLIDPQTGVAVRGRHATITIRIGLLTERGLEIPRGTEDTTKKPWLVSFDDINGDRWEFKVDDSHIDRTLGIVTCDLGLWRG